MTQFIDTIDYFDTQLKNHYDKVLPGGLLFKEITASINYSLFSGGKRYRPLLSLATAELFDLEPSSVVPLAIAVESIHTYSLIHDDLPCMDNDEERRGLPTNHIQFSEDIALLAGDSLISEALAILAKKYSQHKNFLNLFMDFTASVGVNGMIGGQVLDLKLKSPQQADMKTIHLLKTGQLIKLSLKGVGYIAEASPQELSDLEAIGLNLGYAFQLKDDLQDVNDPSAQDEANMVHLLGFEGVEKELSQITDDIYQALNQFKTSTSKLKELIDFNLKREN